MKVIAAQLEASYQRNILPASRLYSETPGLKEMHWDSVAGGLVIAKENGQRFLVPGDNVKWIELEPQMSVPHNSCIAPPPQQPKPDSPKSKKHGGKRKR